MHLIRLFAVGDLCHLYTGYLTKHKLDALQGVRVLSQAVEKMQQFDTQLTAVHADLCQMSLAAKLFSAALRFLDIDITAIVRTDVSILLLVCVVLILDILNVSPPFQDSNQDARYLLLYYYYGGMIYTAMKDYDRALYFFEVCVSTPALAMSHIMLEAYKKYILVSLILHGKMLPVPKYSSQVITRFMKPLSQAYHDVATTYQSASSDGLRNDMTKYRDVFTRDNNLGLVKQVSSRCGIVKNFKTESNKINFSRDRFETHCTRKTSSD